VVSGSAEQGSQKPTHTANCAVQGRFGMYPHLHYYGACIYATMHGEVLGRPILVIIVHVLDRPLRSRLLNPL
jgi:hypothetical protein